MGMGRVLERDISKDWIEKHLASNEGHYAFRIHDCPWEAKKFDYFLFAGLVTWALEFKVDRRAKFRYAIDELPLHQFKALDKFKNGVTRKSKVVVYHLRTKVWHELEVL